MLSEFWKSEESFRNTFRDMRVGMLLLSLEGRFLAANPAICKFLGYSEAELLQQDIRSITHPADLATTIERMHQTFVDLQISPPFQKRYICKDGTTRWGEVIISIIRGPDTSPKYRLSQIVDITERMERNERLKGYEKVVEGLEEMIAVVDRDYRYVIANRAYLNYRGLQLEELKEHFFPYPLDQQAFENVLKIKFNECLLGRSVAFETKYKYPELGERDLFLSYSPIVGPKGIERVALVMRDFTERKRAEDELARLSRRLARVRDGERRKIAKELHDVTGQNLVLLDTTLNALLTALPKSARKLRKLAKSCQDLSQECMKEVRTLAYLSHPPLLDESGLPDAILHFVEEFGKRTRIRVELEVKENFGRMSPDVELALYKIVQESLTNVHKHSGSLTAEIVLRRVRNDVTLEVRDAGQRVPDPTLKRGVLRPFRDGIGISIMKERTNLIGGRLEITSGPDGTIVRVHVSGVEEGEQKALSADN
jgi:PAS domain S-box-containing protein